MSLSAIDSSTRPKGTTPHQGRQDKPEKPACGKMVQPCSGDMCRFQCIYCAKIVVPVAYDHELKKANSFEGWCQERFVVSPPVSPNAKNTTKIKNMKKENNKFYAQAAFIDSFLEVKQKVTNSFNGIEFQFETMVEFIEISGLLYADLQSATTRGAKIRAFVHAIKHIFRRSIFVLATENISQIATICFDSYLSSFSDGIPLQSGAEDFIESSLNTMHQIEKSQILANFGRLLSYVLSFAAFKEYNINPTTNVKRFKDFSKLLENKPMSFSVEMLRALLESVRITIVNLKKFWITGDAADLIFTEDRITKWNALFHKLKGDYAVLSNPEPFGVCVETFEKEIGICIDEGKYLARNKKLLSTTELGIFERRFQDIQGLERDFKLVQLAQSKRSPPLCLLIHGPSSVGKSSIMHMLFTHFAKVSTALGRPLDLDESYMYNRSVADEYWSGFSTFQWCIVLDDVAISLPAKAAEDPTLDEIIRISNPMPWTPPQAELERKGRYPVCPKLFLASTNVKDLNANFWFSVPIATQRRFPYVITVVPKEQYLKKSAYNTNPMLDTTNLRPSSTRYDDYWKFTVERTVPGPQVGGASHRITAAYEPILVTEDISEFMRWFGSAIKTYYDNMDVMKDAINAYSSVPICPTCFGAPDSCPDTCNTIAIPEGIPLQSATNLPNFTYTPVLEMNMVKCLWAWFIISLWSTTRSCAALCKHYRIPFLGTILSRCVLHFEDRIMRRAGSRIYNFFYHPASVRRINMIMKGLIAIMTWTAITRVLDINFFPSFSKKKKPEPPTKVDGGVFSSNVPEPVKERSNIWTWKEPPTLSSIDLSSSVLSRGAISVEEQLEIFSRNCYYMTVSGGASPTCFGRILGIGGQLYLTNAHFFHKRPTTMFLTKCSPTAAVGTRRNVHLNYGVNIHLDEVADLAIVYVVDLPCNRSLREYMFATDSVKPEFNGFRLTRQENGDMSVVEVVCNVPGVDTMVTRYNQQLMMPTHRGTSKVQTVEGDCGSPLIAVYNGRCILAGLHVGCLEHPSIRGKWRVLSRRIDKQLVDNLLSRFPAQSKILPSKPLMTSLKTGDIPIARLHYKSPFCYQVNPGSMEVFGSIPFREGSKSHVVKTLLCEQFVENTRDDGPLAIVDEMHPPVMRGYEPKHQSLQYMTQTSDNVDYNILQKCKSAFIAIS
jgi:hypothetical protein